MDLPAPDFAPPPQPPSQLSTTTDLHTLGAAVLKINNHLRLFTVWIVQQLHRIQWTLRYNGIHVQSVLVGTVDGANFIFTSPFNIGVTADNVVAGVLLVNGVRLTYTASMTPGAGEFTTTDAKTVKLGTAPSPGQVVQFEWVMEGA